MTTVYLGIGSNLGDREQNIRTALKLVDARAPIIRISPFLETAPAEGAAGGPFLNGAAACRTQMSPAGLHRFLRTVEESLGRPGPHRPGAARPIDLDILYYGDRGIRKPDLSVPHPRIYRRTFVLEPLTAIAPDLRDPITGKTIQELFQELRKKACHPRG